MKEKTKKKYLLLSKSILLFIAFIGVFVLNLFYPGLISISLFLLLYRLGIITEKVGIYGALICTVVLAIIGTIYTVVEAVSNKKSKIANWFSMNYSRYSIFILLFSLGVFSLQNELILKYDEMRDILSLEWTIYGISMTIFLVWNVLVVDYLKRRKPAYPKEPFPTDTFNYINEKGKFYELASNVFSSASILTANTFCLLISSGVLMMPQIRETLISQNLTIFTFFLCTNTLIALFLDVLRPLKEEKQNLLKGTKVTDKDVELQNRIDSHLTKTLLLLDEVDKMDNLDEEQRKTLRTGILINFKKTSEAELTLPEEEMLQEV